jgi:hypothetical protein
MFDESAHDPVKGEEDERACDRPGERVGARAIVGLERLFAIEPDKCEKRIARQAPVGEEPPDPSMPPCVFISPEGAP